jgi:microfibrillar-associated protein 1
MKVIDLPFSLCLQHQFEAANSSRRCVQAAKMPPKMTANPLKPSRHRAGKPMGADASSDSDGTDSDGDVAPHQKHTQKKAAPKPAVGAGRVISSGNAMITAAALARAQVDKERAAREELEQKAAAEGFVTESEEGESESGGDDEDGDDETSSEEESSEDEAPRRLMVRPKFVSRAQRSGTEAKPSLDEDAAAQAKKAEMDAMVEAQLAKDLAARQAGRKQWESDSDPDGDVDTEDDLDPEAEYAAWKLRELRRIKRARERIEAREAEVAEAERRRGLTEEERAAEDAERVARQQEEKDGRGKMGYLQKYYHRGAFFQDGEEAEELAKRDLMGARFADDVRNRELLPQALQMRDMTKLGRKGASKYKDLKSEDTGQWGRYEDHRPGKGGFDRFGDERFRPDREGGAPRGDGGHGANSVPLGRRKDILAPMDLGAPRRPDSGRASGYDDLDRPRRDDRSGPRRGSGSRSRSRSRSRSPRKDRRDGYRDRRKRSTSRERDRFDGDKRRKIESRQ